MEFRFALLPLLVIRIRVFDPSLPSLPTPFLPLPLPRDSMPNHGSDKCVCGQASGYQWHEVYAGGERRGGTSDRILRSHSGAGRLLRNAPLHRSCTCAHVCTSLFRDLTTSGSRRNFFPRRTVSGIPDDLLLLFFLQVLATAGIGHDNCLSSPCQLLKAGDEIGRLMLLYEL